ncbi:hypothetical protein ACKWTF_001795 [Chironomus riparius]
MKEPICNGCCCFSLRTGGLIIGWLNSLIGLFGLIITISVLGYKLSESSDLTYVDMNDFYGLRYVDRTAFIVMGFFLAIIFLIEGTSAVLLIIGIVKGHHKKMYMYLIVSFIEILLEFFELFKSGNSTREIIKDLFGISFQIYYFCVVHSLYTVTKYGNRQPRESYTEEFI